MMSANIPWSQRLYLKQGAEYTSKVTLPKSGSAVMGSTEGDH